MTNRNLKRQLKTLRAIAPNMSWLSARREVLLAQVRAQCAAPAAADASLPLTWQARARERLRALELMLASMVSVLAARGVVVAALVGVFMLASVGYVVAASGNAEPGDSLYKLKLAIEDVRLKLATSPRERVALQTEFASRRLHELTVITRDHGANLPAAETLVSQFESSVDKVSETASQATTGSAERSLEIAKIVDEKVSQYEHVLKETSTTAMSPELSRRVSHALARVNRAGTEALKVLVNKDSGVSADVVNKIDEKIKSAEETLKLADAKLAAGGAKGGSGSASEPESKQVSVARDKSVAAKTNLAEAKKKVVEGDYKAAVAILEGVADIVNDVAETAENVSQANANPSTGEVKGESTETKTAPPAQPADSSTPANATSNTNTTKK